MAIEPQDVLSVYTDTTTPLSDDILPSDKLTAYDVEQSDIVSGIVPADDTLACIEPAQVTPAKKPWWYGVVLVLLFCVCIVGVAWLSWNTFVWVNAWHDAAYTQGQQTGYALGIVDGYKNGYTHGTTDQTAQDKTLLAKTKAADVTLLEKEKALQYNAGAQDEARSLKQWWNAHCMYDKVFSSYVCNQTP